LFELIHPHPDPYNDKCVGFVIAPDIGGRTDF
jgi:hypothetical protein